MAPDERPPTLQPPPRVRARLNEPPSGDRGPSGTRSARAGTTGFALLFGALAIALVIVFVVLPRWTATRGSVAAPDMPAMSGAGIATGAAEPRPDSGISAPVPTAEPAPPPSPTPFSPPPPQVQPRTHSVPEAPAQESAFVAAMSRGLDAVEEGRWSVAREAFETASNLRPGAPEVADGLARVAAAERRSQVEGGTLEGLRFEESEAWKKAEQVYDQVLEIDPEAAGAVAGRERAARRATLDDMLEYHIRNPGRLTSPSVFEDAEDVLEQAREVDPKGPRLERQLSQLTRILEIASTPVPVVVVSDTLTDVVIYRVDRLGAFSRRELMLRPGTYTAVGSRTGFRDVRVRFNVAAGAASEPVTVVCTEKLWPR